MRTCSEAVRKKIEILRKNKIEEGKKGGGTERNEIGLESVYFSVSLFSLVG